MTTEADALLARLQASGKRKLPLSEVSAGFREVCPRSASRPDFRTRLASMLQELAEQEALRLPVATGSHWDRSGLTPLPAWVILPAPPDEKRIFQVPEAYHWVPLLGWAAHEKRHDTLGILFALNEWRKHTPERSVKVPIKERSLEIFGDEKRLDALRSGETLFAGRLTLADLDCFIAPMPMPYEAGPSSGRPLLIIENHDTWHSFCHWNRSTGRYAAVAYGGGGSGKSLGYDVSYIDVMVARTGASGVVYFGDVDPAGLNLGARASWRRQETGYRPIEPETALYAWLLKSGRRVALSQAGSLDTRRPWLPAEMLDACKALFAAGQRIPQESLGLAVLMTGAIASRDP